MFQASTAGRVVAILSAVFAGLLLMAAPARAVVIAGAPVAQNGAGFSELGASTVINDEMSTTQLDTGNGAISYAGVNFGSTATTFNHITLDMTAGFVVSGFKVQYGNVPNPNPAVDADWSTIQTYSGLTSSSGPTFNLSFGNTTAYGIRVLATDKSDIADNRMRIRELWAFSNYSDLAASATLSGTLGQPALTDQQSSDQAFSSLPESATLTWAKQQLIGAILITGGSGISAEHLNDFTITVNGNPTPIVSVTGNTAKTDYYLLPQAVVASSLTLNVTSADTSDGGTLGRVGELWVFEAPEPASMSLVVAGGLMLLKRRRVVR